MNVASTASAKRKRDSDDNDGHESKSTVLGGSIISEPAADHDITNISEAEDALEGDYDTNANYSYHEAQEPFPRFAFYDPRLDVVKRGLEKMAEEARSIFETHDCVTTVAQTLQKKVNEIQHLPKGKTKIIGLVGNAGQGKSSLVNSLTDIPDLAKAGDLGESVTLVATIYRRAFCGQTHRFAARLEYFDSTTVLKLLTDVVEDWKIFQFELPEKITAEEKDQLRDRANTTLSIFRAVFCEHDGFEDDAASRKSLNRICGSNESSAKQVRILSNQAQTMIEKCCSKDKLLQQCFDSDDRDEMHQWLDDRLLEDKTRGGPNLWPFVKDVVIGVKGSRVLDRWNIADLPGLTDCNQVRVDTTLRYIANCDYLWAMDHVGRITTDRVVERLAQRYGLAFKGKLAAIGTRSADNVKLTMVTHYRKRGIETHGQEEWQTTRGAITKELKELMSSRKIESDNAKRIAQLQDERQSIDDIWWAKVVHTRNTFIQMELQRKCQPHMPEEVLLDVICVSNSHYEARKYGKRREDFTLPTDATGIPALRKHVLSLAAPDSFQEVKNFVNHQYTVFIRGLELWASDSLDKGWPDLLKVFDKSQKAIPGSFEMVIEMIKERFSEKVISTLHSNQGSFTKDAQTALEENISPLCWATLQSFIKRNGNHKTPCMADSFNELFVSGVRRRLNDNLWYPMIDFSLEQIEELRRQAIMTISSIVEQLEREFSISVLLQQKVTLLPGEPAAHGVLTDALDATIKGHIAGLRQAFDTSSNQLEKELRSIILRATIDGPDNYFANAMKPAYQRCLGDYGPGVVARWLQYLETHINLHDDQSPFHVMIEAIETDANDAINRCLNEIRSRVDKAYNAIMTDCEAVTKSDTISELPLRLDITDFVQRAVPAFNNFKAKLEAIKEQYPA